MASERPNGSIERLIRVTEERTRAELRVQDLLLKIEQGQSDLQKDIRSLSKCVDNLETAVGATQQMVVLVAQYMAVMAGRDSDQVEAIVADLIAKTGMSVGNSAHIDIAGDMLGGDKNEGKS